MKTLIGFMLVVALIASIGCAATEQDRYLADEPPPLAHKGPAPTVIDPVKLVAARAPLTADEIDDTNAGRMASRLESELKADGRTSANAGR